MNLLKLTKPELHRPRFSTKLKLQQTVDIRQFKALNTKKYSAM